MKEYSTEEVLSIVDSGKKVVIDFSAEWCGPCKSFAPIFEKTSENENFSDISFVKVDVDKNAELPMKYSVRNIPTIILLEKGIIKNKSVGAMTENKFIEFLSV